MFFCGYTTFIINHAGASLDRPNLYGWTALMQACRYGHDGVVLQLLNSKANASVTTPMGLTALSLAIHGGFPKVNFFVKGWVYIFTDLHF